MSVRVPIGPINDDRLVIIAMTFGIERYELNIDPAHHFLQQPKGCAAFFSLFAITCAKTGKCRDHKRISANRLGITHP